MTNIKLHKKMGFDPDGNPIIKETVYTAPRPSARVIRNAAELNERLDPNRLTVADLDMAVGFTCELFGGQITADDIWDGLYADELSRTVLRCITETIADLNAATGKIPNAAAD